MDLLVGLELQAIVQEMGHDLESAGGGIHVQQWVGRKPVAVGIDGHIAGDASEAAIPHATHHVGAVDGPCEHGRILTDALVQGIGVEQDPVEEGGDECRNRLVVAKGVVVFLGGNGFDLQMATGKSKRINLSAAEL